MNTNSTDLTKLTTTQKIDRLLAQSKITLEDVAGFTQPERKCMEQKATKVLAKLTGTERDNFLAKMEQLMQPAIKSDLWDYNHGQITNTISEFMYRHGTMPTKSAIAQQTGLSRQTVVKHMADYKTQPEFIAEMEQFKFMAPKILAGVFRLAGNGDIKAARLYLEMVGAISKQNSGTIVNKQNNYLQINNTILSQENLKHLSPEQLTQIENIVREKECSRVL